MTRVLVVHHDLDLGGQEADSLRRFGYDVIECGGPTRNRCPVLAGSRGEAEIFVDGWLGRLAELSDAA